MSEPELRLDAEQSLAYWQSRAVAAEGRLSTLLVGNPSIGADEDELHGYAYYWRQRAETAESTLRRFREE